VDAQARRLKDRAKLAARQALQEAGALSHPHIDHTTKLTSRYKIRLKVPPAWHAICFDIYSSEKLDFDLDAQRFLISMRDRTYLTQSQFHTFRDLRRRVIGKSVSITVRDGKSYIELCE